MNFLTVVKWCRIQDSVYEVSSVFLYGYNKNWNIEDFKIIQFVIVSK